MVYNYTALIKPSEDNQHFYARIPDLDGSGAIGCSMEDATEQMTYVAAIWLVGAELDKIAIPQASIEKDLLREEGEICVPIRIDTTEVKRGMKSIIDENQDTN